MSEIDIRDYGDGEIRKIRFFDECYDGMSAADVIRLAGDEIQIIESGNSDYVRVYTAEQAKNLIKALEKALELEWVQ